MAADHFLDRGFRHLAFCGYVGVDFSDQRTLEFTRYLREKSIAPHIFTPRPSRLKMDSIAQEFRGALDHADIARWLLTLPKPVGVLACNDLRGKQVLDACIGAKLRVPEEVAVIGVDNDEVVCELADPPLSSIVPDVVRIGFRGAEMLHQQLRGQKVSTRIEHIPPRGIVTRRSSDILAIDDPVVAEAMHLIRERACSEFNVENLLDRMTVSRSTLERRFDELLGHSPKQEILKVRLARVRQLLQETKYPLWTIAEMTGFKTAAHLSVAFRSHFGGSPGELRAG
jgi:LacI family transcriptional regulator